MIHRIKSVGILQRRCSRVPASSTYLGGTDFLGNSSIGLSQSLYRLSSMYAKHLLKFPSDVQFHQVLSTNIHQTHLGVRAVSMIN